MHLAPLDKLTPYIHLARYHRPVGYLLLFFPCAWGLTIGAPSINLLYAKYTSLSFFGSVLMRSSGCIINDLWDREIDRKVSRTKDRPIASKQINSKQALVFLSLHLVPSLLILLQFPPVCRYIGLGTIPMVVIYPYMKRVTFFPQVFLGLSFSSGIPIGLLAMGSKNFSSSVYFPLYASGVLWTLIYDTIYAHMDRVDDVKAEVKSTALYFKGQTKRYLIVFSMCILYLCTYVIKVQSRANKRKVQALNIVYLTVLYQIFSIIRVDLNSPSSCMRHFNQSPLFGFGILTAFFLNKLL